MTERNTDSPEEKPLDTARRRFLKAAIYVPPAVVTTLAVRNARANTPSCAPNESCEPTSSCPPLGK